MRSDKLDFSELVCRRSSLPLLLKGPPSLSLLC
jgi:hypothetical protein